MSYWKAANYTYGRGYEISIEMLFKHHSVLIVFTAWGAMHKLNILWQNKLVQSILDWLGYTFCISNMTRPPLKSSFESQVH